MVKFDEPGIIIMDETISPEAYRAQRLAELKDLAEYRRRHLQKIQEWSKMTDAQREQFQTKMREEERAARAEVAQKAEAYAKWYDQYQRPDIKVKEVVKKKEKEKIPWYIRAYRWFKGANES